MDEPGRDPLIDAVARSLREPVDLGQELDARVLAALRSPRAAWYRRLWRTLCEPRMVPVSPLAALGSMALIVAAVVALNRTAETPVSGGQSPGDSRRVTFELTAPDSRHVSLAGDFNDWNGNASPLVRKADGLWTITIPLRPGRYRYTFLVDGERWVSDPAQPPAMGDDFGAPTSVITIAQR